MQYTLHPASLGANIFTYIWYICRHCEINTDTLLLIGFKTLFGFPQVSYSYPFSVPGSIWDPTFSSFVFRKLDYGCGMQSGLERQGLEPRVSEGARWQVLRSGIPAVAGGGGG